MFFSTHFETIRAMLEPSWDHFGDHLGPIGGPKNVALICVLLGPILRPFGPSWCQVGPHWSHIDGINIFQHSRIKSPTRAQVGTNIGSKIDTSLERLFFKKPCFLKANSRFVLSEVEVGCQHRPTIDQKMHSKRERILASIFDGFLLIFGANLGQI